MPEANPAQTPSLAVPISQELRMRADVPSYAGAFSRQTYHPQLGFLTPNEVEYVRRYGWGTDRSR